MSASIWTIPDIPTGTPMNDKLAHLLHNLFAFDITADLLRRDFVQQAVLAAALLALVAGLIGPFIVMRQMSFAVHGSSELSLTGAAFALLIGLNVGLGGLVGSALAAILFGFLGQRARERDSAIGVVLAFGLGLAVLFIHLYPGRSGTSFALLTGQIVGVGYSGLALLIVVTVLVVAVLAVCYRPLLFATADPEVAAARGCRFAQWESCSPDSSVSSPRRACRSWAHCWCCHCSSRRPPQPHGFSPRRSRPSQRRWYSPSWRPWAESWHRWRRAYRFRCSSPPSRSSSTWCAGPSVDATTTPRRHRLTQCRQ